MKIPSDLNIHRAIIFILLTSVTHSSATTREANPTAWRDNKEQKIATSKFSTSTHRFKIPNRLIPQLKRGQFPIRSGRNGNKKNLPASSSQRVSTQHSWGQAGEFLVQDQSRVYTFNAQQLDYVRYTRPPRPQAGQARRKTLAYILSGNRFGRKQSTVKVTSKVTQRHFIATRPRDYDTVTPGLETVTDFIATRPRDYCTVAPRLVTEKPFIATRPRDYDTAVPALLHPKPPERDSIATRPRDFDTAVPALGTEKQSIATRPRDYDTVPAKLHPVPTERHEISLAFADLENKFTSEEKSTKTNEAVTSKSRDNDAQSDDDQKKTTASSNKNQDDKHSKKVDETHKSTSDHNHGDSEKSTTVKIHKILSEEDSDESDKKAMEEAAREQAIAMQIKENIVLATKLNDEKQIPLFLFRCLSNGTLALTHACGSDSYMLEVTEKILANRESIKSDVEIVEKIRDKLKVTNFTWPESYHFDKVKFERRYGEVEVALAHVEEHTAGKGEESEEDHEAEDLEALDQYKNLVKEFFLPLETAPHRNPTDVFVTDVVRELMETKNNFMKRHTMDLILRQLIFGVFNGEEQSNDRVLT